MSIEDAVRSLIGRLGNHELNGDKSMRRILDDVCGDLVSRVSSKNQRDNISCVIVSFDHDRNVFGGS
jgi:hypothetical protein